MYVPIPLKQVLSTFRGSFQSVDIRSATKKHDSGWLCLLTAIRISARSIEEVKLRHQKLIDEAPTVRAGQFRVLFQAFSFSEIDSLLNELANASLTVEGERIVLPQTVSIDQGSSMVSRQKSFVRAWAEEVWPSATYSFGTRSASFQDPEIAGAVVQNGWPSVESAISCLLEIERQDLYSLSISVFINVEMPAQIKLVSTDDKSFVINVKADRNIKTVVLYWNEKTAGETTKKLGLDKFGEENGFGLLRTKQMRTSAKGDDEFSCWLSHEGVPVIDVVTGRFRDFLPFAAVAKNERTDHTHERLVTGTPHKMKIFISHINEEALLAAQLKKWIEETFAGQCDVFVSSHPKDLPAGTKWLEEIGKALESANVLIVLCSLASIGRPWINFEAGCCWNRKIPIIPVCHSGQRRNSLPPPLSSLQSLDLEDGRFSEQLIHALGGHLATKPTSEIDYQYMNKELVNAASSAAKAAFPKPLPAVAEDQVHDIANFKMLDAIANEGLVGDLLNRRIYTSTFKIEDDALIANFIQKLVRIENRYLDQTLRTMAETLARELDALLIHVRQTFWRVGGEEGWLRFRPDPIDPKVYKKEWKELCEKIDSAWDAYKKYRTAVKERLRV